MPQMQLPIFPEGSTPINQNIAFIRKNDKITYIYGHLPIFIHDVDDTASFQMITSQIYINGTAKQSEISRAFGVTKISVKRSVKKYREKGPKGFYEQPNTRGPSVLIPSVLTKVQNLFNEGREVSEVSEKLKIKKDTLRKAINSGRLIAPSPQKQRENTSLVEVETSTKSERIIEDNSSPIGMGATNMFGRMAASLGKLGNMEPMFTSCLDVPYAGVLLALPALLVNGILHNTDKYFQLPQGYYRLDSIFLLLAFMALSRIKSIEQLRYVSPGEWGKILGLDRIPEAKTLREKIGILAQDNKPKEWAADLSQEWMNASPEDASVLYIDGHVRVYSGHQTKLPKHFVSREKLCLRATVDYWVNAMDGQPFFMINKAVDPGLIEVIKVDILPKLIEQVPNQPSANEEIKKETSPRFTLVFDREGYSPGFFLEMKQKYNVACITYHKYPGDDWREEEFELKKVKLNSGNIVEMKLAERGSYIGKKIWVREIRKLSENGHQTSVLTTDYNTDIIPIAVSMFSRWSQENFFKYMKENYNIDRLIDYSLERIPDTTKVVNPEYRQLDGEKRKKMGQLNRLQSKFTEIILKDDIEPEKVEEYQQKKSDIQDEIVGLKNEVENLKSELKTKEKHIEISKLEEQDRFSKLNTQSKYLIDTIKMIAYRAETAMTNIIREDLKHPNEARSLLKGLYKLEADILPNYETKQLTVRLHSMGSWNSNKIIQKLCDEFNETEMKFPGTDLQIFYEMGS
jgi:hypothetical protein